MRKNGLSILLLIISTFFLIGIIYTTVEFFIADAEIDADESVGALDVAVAAILYLAAFIFLSFVGLCSSVPAMLLAKGKMMMALSAIEFAVFLLYMLLSLVCVLMRSAPPL